MARIVLILLMFISPSYAEWRDLEPLRKPANSSTLADIESHTLPSYIVGGQKVVYRDSDKITSAHEQTHRINSDIRGKFKVDCGFYLLKNKAFTIKSHPRVTLSEIAAKVPQARHTSVYKLYLVSQRQWWDKQPLYLLDETVAYLNGASTGVDTGNRKRAVESFDHCLQLYYFSQICHQIAQNTNYKYNTDLNDIMSVLYYRITTVKDRLEELDWIDNNIESLMDKIHG